MGGGIVDAVVAATATTGPTVSSIVESPSSGDLNAGKTVTLTLNHERGGDGQRAARRR